MRGRASFEKELASSLASGELGSAGKLTRTELGAALAAGEAALGKSGTSSQRMESWDANALMGALGLGGGQGGEDGGGGGGGGGGAANAEPSEEELEGTGAPLDPAVRAEMEQSFGKDFSMVRIHTDAQASAIVVAKGARAFTYKNHIAFAAGAYDPSTPEGKALLVHELTHVAQSGGATSDKAKVPAASDAGGAHEAEADRNAKRGAASAPSSATGAGASGELAAHLAGGQAMGGLQLPSVAAGEAAAKLFNQDPAALYESQASVDPERRHQCSGGSKTPAAVTLSAVTITVTQAPQALSQRGSAEYKVRWSVGGSKNGWVIQHVRWRAAIKDSAGKAAAASNPDGLEFWEAWQVRNGNVYVGSSASAHNADTFRTISENANTKGKVEVIGKVAFVEGYDLQEPPWGHTVAAAGALPTMTTAPDGWSDGAAQDHTLEVDYDDVAKTPQTQVGNP